MSIKELQQPGPGRDVAKVFLLWDLFPAPSCWCPGGSRVHVAVNPPGTRAEKGSQNSVWGAEGTPRALHSAVATHMWATSGFAPCFGLPSAPVLLLRFVLGAGGCGRRGSARGSQPTLCPAAAGLVQTSSCKNSPQTHINCVQLIYFSFATQTATVADSMPAPHRVWSRAEAVTCCGPGLRAPCTRDLKQQWGQELWL